MGTAQLRIQKSKSIVIYFYTIIVYIDGIEYKLRDNKYLSTDISVGTHKLRVCCGDFWSSKTYEIKLAEGETINIVIKSNLSNFTMIIANILLLLTLILSYNRPEYLKFFWIYLSLYSLVPIYYSLIKKDKFLILKF